MGLLRLILAICLVAANISAANALLWFKGGDTEKEVKFKKVDYTSQKEKKVIKIDTVKKSAHDLKIDKLITHALGKEYRRSTIYDIYPVELPEHTAKRMKISDQVELVEYYDYARANLKHISNGVLPQVVKLNFDGDALWDYATIVFNKKTKMNYLVIINEDKILYGKSFEEDYLEPVNQGRFPTVIPVGRKRKNVNSPAMKLVAFDGTSHILFFDRQNKNWNKISLDY